MSVYIALIYNCDQLKTKLLTPIFHIYMFRVYVYIATVKSVYVNRSRNIAVLHERVEAACACSEFFDWLNELI